MKKRKLPWQKHHIWITIVLLLIMTITVSTCSVEYIHYKQHVNNIEKELNNIQKP